MKTTGYAAYSLDSPLALFQFERRSLRPNDVAMEILYNGVCHSDLHTARNDWGWSYYPSCRATKSSAGSRPSVRRSENTRSATMWPWAAWSTAAWPATSAAGARSSCAAPAIPAPMRARTASAARTRKAATPSTWWCARNSACACPRAWTWRAPLLCAGITTYSPLRTWNVGPGSRVGVIGLGGLGHMAVKLAVGMGADVTVLSRSTDKQADALALGASRLRASSDREAMAQAANGFDLIIDTVPVKPALDPFLPLLVVDGTLVIVGQVGPMQEMNTVPLLLDRRRIAGSPIGGIRETQEMLDFCAQKNILPDCEMIRMDEINHAFERRCAICIRAPRPRRHCPRLR